MRHAQSQRKLGIDQPVQQRWEGLALYFRELLR